MLLSRWVLSTLFSLSTSCAIFAQVSIHGSLRGRITDSSGSVVPGAVLTLTNLDNNNSSSATADEAGQYLFARLVPGRYALLVEKSGFQKIVRDRIVIAVNDAAVADVVLTVGAVSETVHVSGETDIVRSQNVEISMLVTEQRIRELPLNGKNFQRLVLLAPGVAGGNPNNPAVSGARALTNTYTIDGTSANDERAAGGLALDGGGAAGLSGASPNMVSTEAVREFNIITSNADATFGRGSGGQVNIITKSGTNDWHGSAYEYLRNDVFDARDFFNFGPFRDSSGRAVVPPFKQNLFGASLGGPLRKDRHFVFGNYEGFRQRLERTASATVPNGDLINVIPGDLRSLYRSFYVDRGIVPATGVPANGTFVALPAATLTAAINGGFNPTLFDGSLANGEAGQVILSTTNTQNVDQDAFLIRTDHRLTDKLNASFRYGFAEPKLLFNQRAVAGITQENLRRWQSVSAQALYTLSPRHLLEVRGGVLRSRMRDRPRDGVESRFVALGVDPQIGLTSIVLGSPLSQLQIPGALGFVDNQTVPQGSAVHTWTSKSLTLRIGLDLRRNILNVLRISNAPFYQFSGFVGTNGLIGANRTQPQAIAIEASGTLYGSPKGPTTPLRGWRNTEHEYFAQLDWRVRPDVTVNLGVRYAYFGVMSEVNGAAANLYAVDPLCGGPFRAAGRGPVALRLRPFRERPGRGDGRPSVLSARPQQLPAAHRSGVGSRRSRAHGHSGGLRDLRGSAGSRIVGIWGNQLPLCLLGRLHQSPFRGRGDAPVHPYHANPKPTDRSDAAQSLHAAVQSRGRAGTRQAHERERRLRRSARQKAVSLSRAEWAGRSAAAIPSRPALFAPAIHDQCDQQRVPISANLRSPALRAGHRLLRGLHSGPVA